MLICIGNAVQTFVGETTQVIDLDGRLVIPGLNDSHLHMSLEANQVYGVDLSHARSIDEIVQAVSERAEQTPPGEWIIGKSNWHEGSLKEGRLPTRSELDQATIVHPVIIHRGGHVITVNSVALELAGITKETPNPPSGVIVRDAAGHPTGIIFGRPAAELVWRHLPDKSMDERADELRAIIIG